MNERVPWHVVYHLRSFHSSLRLDVWFSFIRLHCCRRLCACLKLSSLIVIPPLH